MLSIRQFNCIMSERGSPRASYTASFKLRVVAYAVDKGIRAAGKQFNVDESYNKYNSNENITLKNLRRATRSAT